MGHLHHAVTLLVVDLKRLQPIRLTIKQTSTHKHFSERKSSRNHRWSRQQDNRRIPVFLLDHYYDDQASNDMNHKPKQDDRLAWSNPSPHLAVLYEPFFGPHFWQTPANLELSFSIVTNEPHEVGWTSIWTLRYWTTASPGMLSAVVTWKVLPFFLLQWNLSWVKDKPCSDLSPIHGSFCKNHLITGYSTVWSLDCQLRRRSRTNHNVGNEEPSCWNEKLFFNKEKQPFLKAAGII